MTDKRKRSLEDTLLMLLRTLKLPSFAACYEEAAARGEREGWSFGQYSTISPKSRLQIEVSDASPDFRSDRDCHQRRPSARST